MIMTVTVSRAATAAFDVDAQNTFTPLCPEELPVAGGDGIVPALNAQATLAGWRIGSKDAHSKAAIWVATAEQPAFSAVPGANVDIRWPVHAVPGTLGFELIDGLPSPAQYDFFVWKGVELDMHPYGACYHDLQDRMSTGVIEFARVQGISTFIVGGLATDYCVKTTVLQLLKAGFTVIVNLSACRGISTATVAEAIASMQAAGAVIVESVAQIKVQ